MKANAESNVISLLLGLGIGATIAILFAPKTGNEARAFLRTRVKEGKRHAQNSAGKVQERAQDLLDRGEELISKELERIHSAVNAGREAYLQSRLNASTTT